MKTSIATVCLSGNLLEKLEAIASAGFKAVEIFENDLIAYPAKAAPENSQGVAFFNRMRNLTATGFFTSKMGIKDLDYKGNTPNEWDGVPADVLQQYGYAYDEKTLATCLKIEDRGKLMTWD